MWAYIYIDIDINIHIHNLRQAPLQVWHPCACRDAAPREDWREKLCRLCKMIDDYVSGDVQVLWCSQCGFPRTHNTSTFVQFDRCGAGGTELTLSARGITNSRAVLHHSWNGWCMRLNARFAFVLISPLSNFTLRWMQ